MRLYWYRGPKAVKSDSTIIIFTIALINTNTRKTRYLSLKRSGKYFPVLIVYSIRKIYGAPSISQKDWHINKPLVRSWVELHGTLRWSHNSDVARVSCTTKRDHITTLTSFNEGSVSTSRATRRIKIDDHSMPY